MWPTQQILVLRLRSREIAAIELGVEPKSLCGDVERGFGVAAVVDNDGNLVGIITDGDLRRNMDDLLNRTAQDVMTQDPTTITPSSRAAEALVDMNNRKITCLFVREADSRAPAGILHIHDCLRAGLR